jgi:3,4-dihydroxy-2-butanone 4-phosphate synthase
LKTPFRFLTFHNIPSPRIGIPDAFGLSPVPAGFSVGFAQGFKTFELTNLKLRVISGLKTKERAKMRSAVNSHSRELGAMRNRVSRAVQAFAQGQAILVGDDGRRENEADLVFHASFATPELVNMAIRKACGLLCVSVAHELADRLGIASAPKWPGGLSHTGFTLSIDARNNITSGISASDRAHTIQLLTQPTTTHHDFLSPGHVFPVRAQDGGLLARSGHTEAVMELCQLAGLPPAAAMCEILDSDGEALRPASISGDAAPHSEDQWWRSLPYVSTVDLLWYRLLCTHRSSVQWKPVAGETLELAKRPIKAWRMAPQLEADVLVPCSVVQYSERVHPEKIRIRIQNGFREWSNDVGTDIADAEISLLVQHNSTEAVPLHVADYCDLSAKEGLRGTHMGVRRLLTQLRAFEFVVDGSGWSGSRSEWLQSVALPVTSDRDVLSAVWEL